MEYLQNSKYINEKKDIYTEGIYQFQVHNSVEYDTDKAKELEEQKEELFDFPEEGEIKNQILNVKKKIN